MRPKTPLLQRLLGPLRVKSLDDLDPGECWMWTGNCDRWKPRIRGEDGRFVPVRRVLFEHLIGPLDPNIHLVCKCDLPVCVNPHHMAQDGLGMAPMVTTETIDLPPDDPMTVEELAALIEEMSTRDPTTISEILAMPLESVVQALQLI